MIMPVGLNNRFLLLYASQTGQAKAIAEEIAEKADSYNLHADIHCISETEKKFFIEREKCVVIVTSTTGDGEPPDTALKFCRRIKKKTLSDDHLSHLNYALLGLGDSNYTNFCNCGKNLDRRLQDIGAKHFYESGWADDAVGLELVVEPWMEKLFPAIKKFLGLSTVTTNNSTTPITESIDLTHTAIDDPTSNGEGTEETNQMNKDGIQNSSAADRQIAKVTSIEPEMVLKETDVKKSVTDKNGTEVKENINNSNINMNNGQTNINQNNIAENHVTTNKSDPDVCDLSAALQSGMNLSGEETLESEDNGVTKSLPPLSEAVLTVPIAPVPYLKMDFHPDSVLDVRNLSPQNGASFPSASSPVVMACVTSAMTLTSETAVKKTLLVDLDISGTGLTYKPGDSFSLVCPNSKDEVNMLLKRLGLLDKANTVYRLTILPDTKKRNASVPKHIHESSTLYHTLLTCVDIREPPKKALIRALVDYTEDPMEKRRLQELCSKQGASDYTKFIREPNLSILDLLHHFKSCYPPIERILEHSPRLQPRPYSVSSSPLISQDKLSFVFNVIDIPHGNGRSYGRKGVATGWLESIQSLQIAMEKMNISNEIKVPIFTRTNQFFHLPDDIATPLIMIGPGTGVAPFIGFLDHIAAQRKSGKQDNWGKVWLLFGCRHRSRDFLFQKRLEEHVANSTINKLLVSFSRDVNQPEGSPHYVQDNIRSHGSELVKLLDEEKAIVYVCGDARNMARDVNEAFIEIVSKGKGIEIEEARKYMMKLRLEKRYREDVWT